MNIFDLIIIGSGPAGLTASIYASRYKLSNLVIGKVLGGELSLAHKVENYPGFVSISGVELAEKWKKQAESLGGEVLLKEVGRIEKISNVKFQMSNFKVYLSNNEIYQSQALIVATGSERRRLNIPGEKEYLGRGVSYCTTCDAAFFKDKTVAVIGGADSAVSGAIHLAEYTQKVYLIYRRDKLRAEPVWVSDWKKIEASGKGETVYNTNIIKILSNLEIEKLRKGKQISNLDRVGGVELDREYKGSNILRVDGVFVEIGGVPGTSLVQPLGVKLDETGHVIVDDQMKTNIPGLFCAGDMVSKSAEFKQAIWAMAQGARAASSAYQYLRSQAAPPQRGV